MQKNIIGSILCHKIGFIQKSNRRPLAKHNKAALKLWPIMSWHRFSAFLADFSLSLGLFGTFLLPRRLKCCLFSHYASCVPLLWVFSTVFWISLFIPIFHIHLHIHLQGVTVDESDGLAVSPGRLWEAWLGSPQFLWTVPQDLCWRSGSKILQGKCVGVVCLKLKILMSCWWLQMTNEPWND